MQLFILVKRRKFRDHHCRKPEIVRKCMHDFRFRSPGMPQETWLQGAESAVALLS